MQHSQNNPETPSPALYRLLQVIQWAVTRLEEAAPRIERSAKLLLLAVPAHLIILALWWVVVTECG